MATWAEKYEVTELGRKCITCLLWKSWIDFGKDRSRSTGHTPRCRECATDHVRKRRLEAGEGYRTSEGRRRHLKKYGLTPEEYDQIVVQQCGTCAACGDLPEGYHGKLVVHHCHNTGRFLALVCSPCNLSMGHAKDDANRMRKILQLMEEVI